MKYEAKFYKSAPDKADKNAINAGKGGYAHCIVRDSKTGYILPNCVGMVHAQWLLQAIHTHGLDYALELEARLCRNNAEVYWGYTQDGFERGQEPRRGAIICWRKGKVGPSDGAGHVAIVRDVHANGDITCIASNYSGSKYYVSTYRKAKKYYLGSTYTFQGFIYLPFEIDDFVTDPVARDEYTEQVQVNITNLNVRTGPSTDAHRQGYCAKGYYNVLGTKFANGYTWYKIDKEGLWIANVNGVEILPRKLRRYKVTIPEVSEAEMKGLKTALNELHLAFISEQL